MIELVAAFGVAWVVRGLLQSRPQVTGLNKELHDKLTQDNDARNEQLKATLDNLDNLRMHYELDTRLVRDAMLREQRAKAALERVLLQNGVSLIEITQILEEIDRG